jgi:hypothetical protein
LCVGNFLPTYPWVIKLVQVVKEIREPPVNSLPILIITIDTDFTDLHRRYCPKKLLSFYGFIESKSRKIIP